MGASTGQREALGDEMKYLIALLLLTGCARNVDWVKERGPQKWKEMGYEIVGYEGYQWGIIAGGDVWWSLKRKDSPGVIYSGYLVKWNNELMVYGPRIISGNQLQINGISQ